MQTGRRLPAHFLCLVMTLLALSPSAAGQANVWRLYLEDIQREGMCQPAEQIGDRLYMSGGEYYFVHKGNTESGAYEYDSRHHLYIFTSGVLVGWGHATRNVAHHMLRFDAANSNCEIIRLFRDCPEAYGADACR